MKVKQVVSRIVNMAGGYLAHLSLEEENEFRLYMDQHPKFIALCDVDYKRHALECLYQGTKSEEGLQQLLAVRKQSQLLDTELLHISKEWYEEMVAPRRVLGTLEFEQIT
jgi:hypothetical protein